MLILLTGYRISIIYTYS